MAVSIKDIASRAGISNVTVSLALRDHPRISVARREQVKALAKEMGYRVDTLARAFRMQRSLSVGLLLPNLRTAASNLKVEAIESELVKNGYQVFLGFTHTSAEQLRTYIDNMISRRVDGIIVYGHHGDSTVWSTLREEFAERLPPLVVVDPQTEVADFPCIHIDRAAGMATAISHLMSLGHREFALLGIAGLQMVKWEGALNAVRNEPKARLRYVSLWTREWFEAKNINNALTPPENAGTINLVNQATEIGVAISQMPPSKRPTAVVTMSDIVAMGLINGLVASGLKVPQDISVCGFDGIDIGQLVFRPRLMTLRQPQEDLALLVFRTMMTLLANEPVKDRIAMMPPQLIQGDSVGPPPKRA